MEPLPHGEQGVAPVPYWDPLEWMVRQCHAREMEIHAWINPFRAKTKNTNVLAPNHYAKRYPERCFSYDGLLIMNPALQENREFICHVAADIVRRYDVDGLHIDDYFYPYPAAGFSIPDNVEYDMYGQGMSRDDWRRENVNVFIRMLSDSIHQTKPWVKFGVSPFGIYRNKKSDPVSGSNTNGLQNYDDLYADVLTWVDNGWIDYCVPQLYWQMGTQLADYTTLIEWWNKYAAQRPLFIGEDVERSVKFPDLRQSRTSTSRKRKRAWTQLPNVQGSLPVVCQGRGRQRGQLWHHAQKELLETPGLATAHALHRCQGPQSTEKSNRHEHGKRESALLERTQGHKTNRKDTDWEPRWGSRSTKKKRLNSMTPLKLLPSPPTPSTPSPRTSWNQASTPMW